MDNFKEYLRSTLREAFGDFGTKIGDDVATNINYTSSINKSAQQQMQIPQHTGNMMT